jgi:hypothetical protein
MKHKLMPLLTALACAALAVALAPMMPTATAGYGYDLDEEAQQWYDFAHDKGIEINHLHANSRAAVRRKSAAAVFRIEQLCRDVCRGCPEADRYARMRKTIARKAKFKIAKCTWQAQMKLEDCYADSRQQLEDAGYAEFLPYIYNPYRTAQRELVSNQRGAQGFIERTTHCVSR